MEDNKLVMIDENGNELLAEIVFTFSSDKTGKNYVVFAVEETISAAVYKEDDNAHGKLFPVETDEEWHMIEDMISAYVEDMEAQALAAKESKKSAE